MCSSASCARRAPPARPSKRTAASAAPLPGRFSARRGRPQPAQERPPGLLAGAAPTSLPLPARMCRLDVNESMAGGVLTFSMCEAAAENMNGVFVFGAPPTDAGSNYTCLS